MAEDHSKYMPHHPKPKFAGGGKAKLQDPMLRARDGEPTSHDGSISPNTSNFGQYDQGYYNYGPAQNTLDNSAYQE